MKPIYERPASMSLSKARKIVSSHVDEGVECPCCGQFCKLYKRKLNSGMARILIWLVKEWTKNHDWINVPETAPVFVRRSNEVSRLALWDLVTESPTEDKTRRNSGLWKPTKEGRLFVANRSRVPSHVFIFDNSIYGWGTESVSVVDALGKNFNYQELMNS